jgi:hypothetical protein
VADFPKRPKQHVIADRAIKLVESVLPDEWIIHRIPEQADYGVDFDIELVSKEQVSGRVFKAQVRGHEMMVWRSTDKFSQRVKEETLNYWRVIPLPVILFVVDTDAEDVYWADGKTPRGTKAVTVFKRLSLPATLKMLEHSVIYWLDRRGAKALIYSLPIFSQEWERLDDYVGGDCFLPVDPKPYALLEYAYRQVQVTRDALGLPATMLPWAIWPARSRFKFKSHDEDMYCGTFDEVVEYLTPLYEEMVEVGKREILKESPHPDNATAQDWAGGWHYRLLDLDSMPPEFWKRIDDILKEQRERPG